MHTGHVRPTCASFAPGHDGRRGGARGRLRVRVRSGGEPDVAVVGGQGRSNVARSAQPLKPGRDFGVVEIQMVATVGADELEQPAHAVRAAIAWARRLAPHYRHQAVAQLTRWDDRSVCGICAWLSAVAIALPQAATAMCVVNRSTADRLVRVRWTHFAPAQGQSFRHAHDLLGVSLAGLIFFGSRLGLAHRRPRCFAEALRRSRGRWTARFLGRRRCGIRGWQGGIPPAEGVRCHFSEPLAQSAHLHDKKKMACCRDPNCYRLTMPSWWRDP